MKGNRTNTSRLRTERKSEDKISFGKVVRAPAAGGRRSGRARVRIGVVAGVAHVRGNWENVLFYSQSTKNCRAPGGDVKVIVLDPETQKWW